MDRGEGNPPGASFCVLTPFSSCALKRCVLCRADPLPVLCPVTLCAVRADDKGEHCQGQKSKIEFKAEADVTYFIFLKCWDCDEEASTNEIKLVQMPINPYY